MNNILVQNSKILSVVSHFYGVMPSTSWWCAGNILSTQKKWENKTCRSWNGWSMSNF
jgi:hypothetical protein